MNSKLRIPLCWKDEGYPVPDEPFVADWTRYVDDAGEIGVFEALCRRLVQFRFPIAAGISGTPAYQAATRRGVVPRDAAMRLSLSRPDALRLFLYPTPVGRVPVIVAGVRTDFERIVQALTRRNEPDPIPPSMGACCVAGYNNWDRVATFARREKPALDLSEAIREIAPHKELYQDRFIILSSGPYSSVPAETLGVDPREWNEMSLRIRLEHECTHYFMRRAFGAMRESLLDELVADYAALVTETGRFRAAWFLAFLGLESFPRYRTGGRLENYRGAPPLSEGAFVVLQAVVTRAARSLETLDDRRHGTWGLGERVRWITAVARLGLEGLAGEAGCRWFD